MLLLTHTKKKNIEWIWNIFPNSSQEYVISDIFVHNPILKAFKIKNLLFVSLFLLLTVLMPVGDRIKMCYLFGIFVTYIFCARVISAWLFCVHKNLFSWIGVGDKLFRFRYCPCLVAINFRIGINKWNSNYFNMVSIDNFQLWKKLCSAQFKDLEMYMRFEP